MSQWLHVLQNESKVDYSTHHDIALHLSRLLATRKGSLAHLPDYGLPDIVTFYQGFPEAKAGFIQAVRETILRYEKRLSALSICEVPSAQANSVLNLRIEADVVGVGAAAFEGCFLSGGTCLVTEQ